MAGDWIKIEHALARKPEVFHLAEVLRLSIDDVIGKLVRLWCWVDEQSRNGHDLSVTYVTVASIVSHDGFAEAMQKVGWLTSENGVLAFPNFDRHNGKTAKNRALGAQRKFRERSRTQRDNSVTREEKSLNTPLPTLSRGNGTPLTRGPAARKRNSKSKATPRQQGTNPRAQGTNPRAVRSNGSGVLSDNAILALGIKLGVPARPGETMDAYRGRVLSEDHRRHDD